MYSFSRKIRVRLGEGESAIHHVKRIDRMADIHDIGVRNDVKDYSLDGSDEVVIESKVSGQCNDRTMRQTVLTSAKLNCSDRDSNLRARPESRK